MGEPVALVPARTDTEVAAELRADVTEKLVAVCKAMDAATAGGFVANFNIGMGPYGRYIVQAVTIAKHF